MDIIIAVALLVICVTVVYTAIRVVRALTTIESCAKLELSEKVILSSVYRDKYKDDAAISDIFETLENETVESVGEWCAIVSAPLVTMRAIGGDHTDF